MLVTAVLLSTLSLALQLKKLKPAPLLDQFMVPAKTTELQHRIENADREMIRDAMVTRQGIGVPFVHHISDDHEQVYIHIFVSEEDLPKSYDDRKSAMMNAAWVAFGDVAHELDLNIEKEAKQQHIIVRFFAISDLIKDSEKAKPYAEFKAGELSFH
jgi:hypothetical protein